MYARRSTTLAAFTAITAFTAFTALTFSLLPADTAFAAGPGPGPGAAAAATTLYVDNTVSTCSDTGTGTAAVPYCTIQAAADVVQAGQTVHIVGTYTENVALSHSGTAANPIVITGDTTNDSMIESAGGGVPAFGLDAVQDVTVRDLTVQGPVAVDGGGAVTITEDNVFGITIDGVNGATVDGDQIAGSSTNAGVHVTGGSKDVTVSRDQVSQSGGPGVQIDGGGSGDVVTTDDFNGLAAPAIEVDGTPGTAIASNSVNTPCNDGIVVTGTATGTSVENNAVANVLTAGANPDCPAATQPAAGLLVDAAAAPGVTADYNDVFPVSAATAYEWTGTAYANAAALTAAVGQGAHDLNADPGFDGYWDVVGEGSPLIDSANANAPGELSTDLYGLPRVDDPLTPNTGAGSVGYYDRGAYEMQDSFSLSLTQSATKAPVGGSVTFTGTFGDAWNETLGVTYDFGDGSADVSGEDTVAHSFATAGEYQVTAKVTDSSGLSQSTNVEIAVVASAPLVPALSVQPIPQGAVEANASGTTDSWNITDYSWTWGDGTTSDTFGGSSAYHRYTAEGTYTITLKVTDASGRTAVIQKTVTNNASDFTPYGPVRVLDTRNGTGTGGVVAKVGAGKSVSVLIAGNGSIPATGVTAVALNVTVTDTSGSGNITAYAGGTALPHVSNLNYKAGQTIANAVVVPVGANGEISLANSGASAGSVDLVADVTGYFDQSTGYGFTPLTPSRILDTRRGTGTGGTVAKIPAGGTIALTISSTDGGPIGDPSGVNAVVLNVTATDTAGSGFIEVYPDGTARPESSNVNYTAGQTIANTVIAPVGADGKIEIYNGGANAGSVDVLADVSGYFNLDSYSEFVPIAPQRLLDTRTTKALGRGAVAVVDPSSSDVAIPSGADAFVFNGTVTEPTGTGFIEAYPDGAAAPGVSNINYVAGETIPNVVVAMPGSDGGVDFLNGGSSAGNADLIVDVFGYFLNANGLAG